MAALALFAFTFLPCSTARAASDNATVNAGFVEPSVDAGQPAEFHIEITNGTASKPPPAPQVDGLTFSFATQSESHQFSVDNFQMHRQDTTIYVYSVETSKPGRFVIPGQQIDVGGTSLRTPPTTLTVLGSGTGETGGEPAGNKVSAELTLSKTSAYVGEAIPAEIRNDFGTQVRFQADADPILNGEGFSAKKFTQPRGGTQVVDGANMHTATYKTAIFGAKIGTLTIGPAEISPLVQLPLTRSRSRRNDIFGDPIFDDAFGNMSSMGPVRRVKLPTNTVNVEIEPLPPGKPTDFSGGVGDFKLEAEADPRKAQAGRPCHGPAGCSAAREISTASPRRS